MKLLGFFLLVAGGALAAAAVALLRPGASRGAFVLAGAVVEVLGLALAIRAHVPERRSRR